MRLAVVTVNYCCADAIVERLAHTANEIAACDGHWFIVDNHSPDDSANVLSAAIANTDTVHLIVAEKNGGFGYGNNQVIKRVISGEIDPEYLYFLNPDASPEAGAISEMISYLDENRVPSVLGTGLLNEDGSHTPSMFRFPSFWSEIESALAFGPVSRLLHRYRQPLGETDRATAVDWVAGTSFMVRAEVFRTVGGFDEDFFLYWEEVELCHRIKKAGFAIYSLPSAKVRHLGGVSTGMHNDRRAIPGYWHRSRNLYYLKTKTAGPLLLLNFVTAICLALRRCLEVIRRRPITYPRFLRDHIKYALESER